MSTPLGIQIMLHYYAHADQFRGGDFSPPAVRAELEAFVEAGLLMQLVIRGSSVENYSFEITDGGRVYVEALKRVPLPRRIWAMPTTMKDA